MIFRLHNARHFIDDVPVCEDIVSDVFATLWDRATSLHLMIACAPAYIKMCEERSFAEFLYEECPDGVFSLDELYRMLYEELEKLPESHREVFVKSVGRYKHKTLELLRSELKDWLPLVFLFLTGSSY